MTRILFNEELFQFPKQNKLSLDTLRYDKIFLDISIYSNSLPQAKTYLALSMLQTNPLNKKINQTI